MDNLLNGNIVPIIAGLLGLLGGIASNLFLRPKTKAEAARAISTACAEITDMLRGEISRLDNKIGHLEKTNASLRHRVRVLEEQIIHLGHEPRGNGL